MFGVQPERDPNVVPRMRFATGVVTGLVSTMLAAKLAKSSSDKGAADVIPKAASQQSGHAPTGSTKIPSQTKSAPSGSIATTKPKDVGTISPTTKKAPVSTKKPSAAGSSSSTQATPTPKPSGSSTDAAMEGKKPSLAVTIHVGLHAASFPVSLIQNAKR